MSGRHEFQKHQRRALRYAQDRDRIALFMEMRLGKSPVSIRWASDDRRVLLVAPLSTLLGQLNWHGELVREGITPTMLPNVRRQDRERILRPSRIRDGRLKRRWATGWFGVNFEALRTQPFILDAPWDAIIIDESTRIRSPRAQVTKLLLARASHIPRRAILSGLPNPETPMDYFCQFKFLDGEFMGFDNFWAFKQSLFRQTYPQWNWQPKSGVRQRIKEAVHERAFVLTRKQAGVGSDKVREQRSVPLNAAQKRAIKEIRKEYAIDGTETKWAPVAHLWQQRLAGGFHPITKELLSDAKVRLAEELVMDEFRRQSIVMWFRFNHEIDFFYKWMKKRNRKLRVERVHGNVKDSKQIRGPVQDRFQDGFTRLVLLQIKLGKFGWNLSKSSTAVYYSNSYEFEDRSQSEDRIIHLTKRDPCLYVDLVTVGTPDEAVVDALSDKRITARQFNTKLHNASLVLPRVI